MPIETGAKLPDATFLTLTGEGPKPVAAADYFAGKTVVIFGLPGAYTGTCTFQHMPSFTKNAEALRAKGVDAIACVSVNDPFVLGAWAESTGADKAGVDMLADAQAEFTKAVGLDFSAPPVGLIDRSLRYSMLVRDGVVEKLNVEENPGQAVCSTGDAMLDLL